MDILIWSCLPFALPMWYRLEWAQCRSRRCRSWVRYAGPLAFPWLSGICLSLESLLVPIARCVYVAEGLRQGFPSFKV
jgi:hypothetical protein